LLAREQGKFVDVPGKAVHIAKLEIVNKQVKCRSVTSTECGGNQPQLASDSANLIGC